MFINKNPLMSSLNKSILACFNFFFPECIVYKNYALKLSFLLTFPILKSSKTALPGPICMV